MAFKNVARPRFWINTTQWLRTVIDLPFEDEYGLHEIDPSHTYDVNASLTYQLGTGDWGDPEPGGVIEASYGQKSFLALLGHNITSGDDVTLFSKKYAAINDGGGWASSSQAPPLTDYLNGATTTIGTSIWTFDGNGIIDDANQWKIKVVDSNGTGRLTKISSAVIGTYYEVPRSPDLSVKMSWEYDGIDTFKSIGGGTFSNARYTGPANFGSYGAWEQGGADRIRTGRRTWEISFSYLTAEESHPVNSIQYTGAETSDGYGDNVVGGQFAYNAFNGTDLYTQLISRCMGPHIPFIFQPDMDNNNPDQFAICRFDQKSFTYDKISDNLYKIKFKIRESW